MGGVPRPCRLHHGYLWRKTSAIRCCSPSAIVEDTPNQRPMLVFDCRVSWWTGQLVSLKLQRHNLPIVSRVGVQTASDGAEIQILSLYLKRVIISNMMHPNDSERGDGRGSQPESLKCRPSYRSDIACARQPCQVRQPGLQLSDGRREAEIAYSWTVPMIDEHVDLVKDKGMLLRRLISKLTV